MSTYITEVISGVSQSGVTGDDCGACPELECLVASDNQDCNNICEMYTSVTSDYCHLHHEEEDTGGHREDSGLASASLELLSTPVTDLHSLNSLNMTRDSDLPGLITDESSSKQLWKALNN